MRRAARGTVLAPLPAELAQAPCLTDDEVRYIGRQAAAIEAAEGAPQDVEWAIARDQDLPDSVYFLQHRPETTWRRRRPPGDPSGVGAGQELRSGAVRAAQRVQGAGHVTSSPEEPQTGPEWPSAASASQLARESETRPANAELRLAVAAARAGGAVLMKRLRAGADLEVGYKDARANLVTAADREAQRAVTAMILATFPQHLVNGEEGTAGDPGSSHVWYVDPLDGTTNYAHGLPFFCVSVALRAYGRRVAGAVYDPLHEELYAAGPGAARR